MNRSKNPAKQIPKQRSISSFFTSVGPCSNGSGASKHNGQQSSLACITPSSLAHLTEAPSRKRKREAVKSVDVVQTRPADTSRNTESPLSNTKKTSLGIQNSVAQTSLLPSVNMLLDECVTCTTESSSIKNHQDNPNFKFKKDSPEEVESEKRQSPRKGLNLKSPTNDVNNCSKPDKSLLISPIKSEEDEVLKSILKDLSPHKVVSENFPARTCQSNPFKKKIITIANGESKKRDVPTFRRQFEESRSSLKVNKEESNGNPLANKKTSSGNKTPETVTKVKQKKSAQSPLDQDLPELKYPPLPFELKVLKSKASRSPSSTNLEENMLSVEKSSDKEILIKAEGCTTPVRRSPRKHPLSPVIAHEKVKTSLKFSGRIEISEEKNKVESASSSPLRRSPRKHTTISVEVKSSSSSNELDLSSGLHDDYDDVMTFMANINENDLLSLDLTEAQLCKIMSIAIKIPFKEAVIEVKSVHNQRTTSCKVRGCWLACPVGEGDSISLQAVKIEGEWLLDTSQGFLVLHPDVLISGTAVVGSLFCLRRSVLSSLFRGMDSDSPVMVIGSIVHELFQMVLQQKRSTEDEVKKVSAELISSRECVQMLYAANMTLSQIQKELSLFIPRIVDFVAKYVEYPKTTQKKNSGSWLGAPKSSPVSNMPQPLRKSNQVKGWDGKIIGIRDIEETFWEPKLGIKGMVDVSVEVRDGQGNRKVMPLELKTGRASFSAEHRGQVTLYTMMMTKLGYVVDSGLLLYLREGQMQEISVAHNESKDLIQLRNTLAHYLRPRVPTINEQTGRFFAPRLPEPINFKSACEKCPYSTLCSVYLKLDGLSNLPADHPMVSISSSTSQHLTQNHIDYVMHWVGLLLLEDSHQMQSIQLKYIWRFSPEEREKNRKAIVNLHLVGSAEEDTRGKYLHTFTRAAPSCNSALKADLKETGLNAGDYILISTDKRIAIEHGSIVHIDSLSVKVSTNRNLYDHYAQETFHLDTSESNTVLVFNLTNLGCLLENNESAERLRKVVIDRAVPSFTRRVEKSTIQDCLQIFRKLNENQRKALLKTLRTDTYLLIKGLPGTGKTATMVALVQLLIRAGLSILVTSHTHSAVDNLLLRLKSVGVKFLRLGTDARIHPQLHAYSESSLTKHCKTPEDLDKVYNQQQIIGVTCLGAGHACLLRRTFDICLVDESTQVLQPSILRPLFCAHRFVLVGDPDQLPPVVKSHQAQELGLSESLFSHLDLEEATVSLTLNYRMNQVITDLANKLTYDNKLECGNDCVANATLKVVSQTYEKTWISTALSRDIDKSVVFVDTCGVTHNQIEMSNSVSGKSDGELACCNHVEVSMVLELLKTFVAGGVSSEEVGVMAPYRAQVSLLTEAVKSEPILSGVEVNTVDQFQGRDKEVVVYSCTRADGMTHSKPKDRDILNDHRRLTVAITRAKHKLVMIGHSETLQLYAPFQKLLSCLSNDKIVSAHS